ncbi:hypothetical protein EMPS_10839 [Entomortierella parvispora]|uniref:Uncharacterized protein n=1 Tax=Entomortierella parvispora TaxID=205924 RepID=A0A9P3HKM6_9FUNG|nr:hypothetical protein EMPS_10839 [Entomortierella parvispora]
MFDQTSQPAQGQDLQSLPHFVPNSQPPSAPRKLPPSIAAHSTPKEVNNSKQESFKPTMPRANSATMVVASLPNNGVPAVRKEPLGPSQVAPKKKPASAAAAAAAAGSSKSDLVLSLSFVGMKYRGRHVFSSSDIIVLQNDDKNPYDKNAIKVMLKKNGAKWKHVAYVAGDDAKKLRECASEVRPERACLKFVSNSYTKDTAYYRMTIPRK